MTAGRWCAGPFAASKRLLSLEPAAVTLALVQRLVQGLKSLRFRQRWLLAYAALIIAPLAALTFYSYSRVSSFIRDQVRSSTAAAVDRAIDSIETKLDLAARLTSAVFSDQRVRDILARPTSPYPIGAQIDDYWYLESVCRGLARASEDVARIRLYVGPDRIYSNENVVLYNLAAIAGTERYARAAGSDVPVYGSRETLALDYTQTVEVVSFMRAIRSFSDRASVTGMVSVDLRAAALDRIALQTISAGGGPSTSSTTREKRSSPRRSRTARARPRPWPRPAPSRADPAPRASGTAAGRRRGPCRSAGRCTSASPLARSSAGTRAGASTF